MRAREFINEGLGSWINNKLGKGTWGDPGDVVSGKTVSRYLDSIGVGGLGPNLERSDYELKDIDLATARKYRRITDKELRTSAIDQVSLAGVKDVSYASLLKKPPVLLASGQVLDGNHRLERAIRAKLPRIPVLIQVTDDGLMENLTNQQMLKYVKKIHPDFHPDVQHSILNHAEWELTNYPVDKLQIADEDDIEDPYNRVIVVDPEYAKGLPAEHIKDHPIIVDADGYIIDGNHRAYQAKKLGLKSIPAYVPYEEI